MTKNDKNDIYDNNDKKGQKMTKMTKLVKFIKKIAKVNVNPKQQLIDFIDRGPTCSRSKNTSNCSTTFQINIW